MYPQALCDDMLRNPVVAIAWSQLIPVVLAKSIVSYYAAPFYKLLHSKTKGVVETLQHFPSIVASVLLAVFMLAKI